MTNPNFLNNYWVPLPHTRAPAHTYFQFLLLLTPANTSRKKLKGQYSCGRDFRLSAYKNCYHGYLDGRDGIFIVTTHRSHSISGLKVPQLNFTAIYKIT